MDIHVDIDTCVGSGNCENAAPEVFQLGDEGYAEVINPNPDSTQERRVRGAALGCPTGAIRLES